MFLVSMVQKRNQVLFRVLNYFLDTIGSVPFFGDHTRRTPKKNRFYKNFARVWKKGLDFDFDSVIFRILRIQRREDESESSA